MKKGSLEGEDAIPNPDGTLVDITCLNLSACISNTDEAIFAAADELV